MNKTCYCPGCNVNFETDDYEMARSPELLTLIAVAECPTCHYPNCDEAM